MVTFETQLRTFIIRNLLLLLSFFGFLKAQGQGVYTDFGENRISNTSIVWEKINSKNDEIIFEKGQAFIAETVIEQFAFEKKNLERQLQYQLRSGIRVVIYTNFADYSHSNFSINNQQFYAGGHAYTPHNEVFAYFNGNYKKLIKDIKEGIARVMINEMILGGTMLERVQSSALLTLPEWFVGGLASYLAEPWNTNYDNLMRDAIAEKKFKNFTSLEKDQSIFAGHSIWFFIDSRFGKEKIKNILFHARITRNVESGISIYTGLSMSGLLRSWDGFFYERYKNDELVFTSPRGEESKLNKHSGQTHTGMSISPDGKNIAFITNNRGAYKVWIYNVNKRNSKLLLRGGLKTYARLPNYFFPVVKWVSNNKVAVLEEYKGGQSLSEYNIISKNKTPISDIKEFDWVKDFAFNKDGSLIAIAGIIKGKTNLYLKSTKEKSYQKLTNDLFDISDLSFTMDDNILFVSNASNNQVNNISFTIFNSSKSVFLFNTVLKTKTRITPIDFDINYAQPIDLGNNNFSFTSDIGGIYNSYVVEYKGKEVNYSDFKQQTNYNRSILFQVASTEINRIAELVFTKDKYRIYISNYSIAELGDNFLDSSKNQTSYRKQLNKKQKAKTKDSTNQNTTSFIPEIDSIHIKETPIDTVIPTPKPPTFITHFPNVDYVDQSNFEKEEEEGVSFGTEVSTLINVDYFLIKFLDNSIWGDYYFQGGVQEGIFNSTLFSPNFIFSLSDMHKNHVLEAGLRYMGTLNGSDYMIKYKNRKGRINKEVFFNRRARYFNLEQFYQRNIMTQGGFQLNYPLSEKSRLEARFLLRKDQHLDLSIDSQTLSHKDPTQLLLSTRLAYVYDNTVSRDLNMLVGTRFKLFADPYFGLDKKGYNLMLGIDIRNYTKISRNLIWANRFVANTSLGSLKTAYFLGGPENWYLNQFEGNVGTLRDPEYILQTLGAPVRGFTRNARSGTSYMVFNSEIRFPIFSYFFQKPIRQEWLRSFMLVAFADVGSAWVGRNPYGAGNPYNTVIFNQPDIDISVTALRNPFILGTGVGARMKFDSYYIKYDAAFGMMEDMPTSFIHHFSLGLDF